MDGTLAHHEPGAFDDNHVGKPLAPMVKKVREWLAEGKDVRIFTARKPHPAIRRFCKENFGKVLPITNKKDPGMTALYDDRAVSVKRNEGLVFSKDAEAQVHEP